MPPASQRIGYIDAEAGRIYLDPQQAKEVARAKGLAGGQPYENPESIARDLNEAGLLTTAIEGKKRRLTLRKRIRDINGRYLTFKITAVLGEEDVPTED